MGGRGGVGAGQAEVDLVAGVGLQGLDHGRAELGAVLVGQVQGPAQGPGLGQCLGQVAGQAVDEVVGLVDVDGDDVAAFGR